MNKKISLIAAILLFSGCANSNFQLRDVFGPNYDIEPKLEKSGISINGLNFPKAKQATKSSTNTPDRRYMGKFLHSKVLYHLGDNSCEIIKYELKRALQKGYYMNYDTRLWYEKGVKQGKLKYCDEVHMANVSFVGCKSNADTFYFVSSSQKYAQGYGFKENKTLWLKSKKCFDKLLNHFKKMAHKDGVEIRQGRFE